MGIIRWIRWHYYDHEIIIYLLITYSYSITTEFCFHRVKLIFMSATNFFGHLVRLAMVRFLTTPFSR